MFDKVLGVLGGGLASTIMDGIKSYFPPDMTEEQKAAVSLEIQKIELQKQSDLSKAIAESEKLINERIAQNEGTAKDLLSLPFIGRVVIFARGCQRPVWGFATLWADMNWFSGVWVNLSEKQEAALLAINILVLGFLFGERAVKNLMPIISQYLGKGK